MNLGNWLENGWLEKHSTSKQEISQLLDIVNRDLKDALQTDLSADWRFGIAYNAALKLCTILLYIEGFRPARSLAHYRTLRALPLILGKEKENDADYLDSCRAKRNAVEYNYTGGATDDNAEELISFVKELKTEVLNWIHQNHPQYLE